jgi:T5SS/PEP-CTERM-associated repeat protein
MTGKKGNRSAKHPRPGQLAWALSVTIGLRLAYLPLAAPAAILVDPNSDGYTNVNPDPNSITSFEDLFIGETATGAVRVDGASNGMSNHIYVGNQASGTGFLTVSGNSSVWTCSSGLVVGNYGAGKLTIENGGQVNNDYAWVGINDGSTGTIIVTESGSTWNSSGDVVLGFWSGGRAQLDVTNGAQVSTGDVHLARAQQGSMGTATVHGLGSTWTCSGFFVVGLSGSGTLHISGGALVSTEALNVANETGSIGDVTVNGSGSTLMATYGIGVGKKGDGTLSVTNGGAVVNIGATIGTSDYSSGLVTVDGPDSTWTNSSSLFVGDHGNGTLNILGGGQVNCAGGLIANENGSSGSVTVNGTGSIWTSEGSILVGHNGIGTLDICDGGQVSNTRGWIGSDHGSTSSGNVMVDGAGSIWTNTDALQVGEDGEGTLSITNGGQVSNANSARVGGRENGSVTVNGTGSTWTSSGKLSVSGRKNATLDITAGGRMNSAGGYVGEDLVAKITVDGMGSTWTNSGDLTVDVNGSLDITDGGQVNNLAAWIGYLEGSTSSVRVEGSGSSWTGSESLYVGFNGNGTLEIINGGLVDIAGTVWVGQYGGNGSIDFSNGTLITTSILAAPSDLTGTGTIYTEGWIFDKALLIDVSFDPNLQEQISGPGQNITVNVNLTGNGNFGAGYSGTGSASIVGGMTFHSSFGHIGLNNGSIGSITVDGIDSEWNIDNNVSIGCSGSGRLDIFNGARVANYKGTIAEKVSSMGTVTVMGSGSTWINETELYVGEYGDGLLSILDGGQVTNRQGMLGNENGSSGTVIVDGVGSSWNNIANLFIAYDGEGTLEITGGASVTNEIGLLGSRGAYGAVTVDGAGSNWTNNRYLAIGQEMGRLDISDGGHVAAGEDLLLYQDSTLAFGIASVNDPFLDVAEDASLDGDLEVSWSDGFTPNAGDSFAIITAATITGTFDTVTLADPGNGKAVSLSYEPTAVRVTVSCASDPNLDGDGDGVPDGCDVCPGVDDASIQCVFDEGSGTPDDPYLISSPTQLNSIGANPAEWDKCFMLTNDIDMSGIGNAYNIIGIQQGSSFTGVFDGNGHVISNIVIDTAQPSEVGMFGHIEGSEALGGIVRDLGLINPQITASSADFVGAFAGFSASEAQFWNCYVAGGNISGDRFVGGIAGGVSLGPVLANCYTTCSVSGTEAIGGLIGLAAITYIVDCYSGGAVTGSIDVGGLCGGLASSFVYQSYAYGPIVGTTNVGGVIGRSVEPLFVFDTFWDTQTTGQPFSLIGEGKTTAQMQDQATYLNAGWDFVGEKANGPSNYWAMPTPAGYPILWYQQDPLPPLPAFSGGSGTAQDPWLIATTDDLNCIESNPRLVESCYRLTNDLDLSGINLAHIGGGVFPFQGCFDGRGFTISNIVLEDPSFSFRNGFFSWVGGEQAEITDLHLQNVTADGFVVGGLLGRMQQGLVERCSVREGQLNAASTAGGFAGSCEGTATVESCFADIDVSSTGFEVGGFAGTIRHSVRVANCYARGDATGDEQVGGFAGILWNEAVIDKCYSTGLVTGNALVGGLIGEQSVFDTIVLDSFWDQTTSGQSNSDGGFPASTSSMQQKNQYLNANWDFQGETANGTDDIWRMCTNGIDYPKLRWQHDQLADWLCPDGVAAEDLALFTDQWLLALLTFDVAPLPNDGQVNWQDFAALHQTLQIATPPDGLPAFTRQWLAEGTTLPDLAPHGGDGRFDLKDFATIAHNWLTE